MQAFLLAGGLSTRMGRDKALLELDGRPLVQHMLAKIRELGLPVKICGSRPDLERFAPVVPDEFAQCGPLGGIEAALRGSDAELNLFLAVDLPQLPVRFLRWMAARAEVTSADATVPFAMGRPQPLCAIYHRRLAAKVRQALQAGDYRVMGVMRAAGIKLDRFDLEAMVACGQIEGQTGALPHRWFQNLNTPSDLSDL